MAPPAGTTPPIPEQATRTPKIPQPRNNPAHHPHEHHRNESRMETFPGTLLPVAKINKHALISIFCFIITKALDIGRNFFVYYIIYFRFLKDNNQGLSHI